MSAPEAPQGSGREDAWARSGSRLKVSAAPAGAVNLNVDGRSVVGPLQGFGQLWQKTYRVRLAAAEVSPQEVIRVWKAEFPRFQPAANRFYPSLAGIAPGEVVLVNARTPGGMVSTGVMVLYADDESFSLMTPQGHPEAGWVTFSAFRDADGTVVAQVQSMARANDPFYELAFRMAGSRLQERIWNEVLRRLAAHFGVEAEVAMSKTLVDPRVQWAQMRNLWHNAMIRTLFYTLGTPLRWTRRRR